MTLGRGSIGSLCTREGNIANLTKLEKHTDWGREVLAQEADNDQLVKTKRHSCLNSFGSGLDICFDMKQRTENDSLQNMLPPSVVDRQVTMLTGDFSLFSCSYNRYC